MIKILTRLPRIGIFMLTTLFKLCRTLLLQMWLNSSFKNCYASLSRLVIHPFQEWAKAHLGIKRLIIGCVFLLLLLYLWPFGRNESSELLSPQRWLSATHRPLGSAEICVESKLERFRKRAETFDVMINHQLPPPPPLVPPAEKPYLPFIGNGYVGVVVSHQSRLHIKQTRTLSFQIPFYPVVEVSLDQHQGEAAAVAVDIFHGVLHKIQCFPMGEACVVVETVAYAHRKRPSVIVQELRIHNPTDNAIVMDLQQIGVSDWSGAVTHLHRTSSARTSSQMEFALTEGQLLDEQGTGNISVVVANLKLPETISVKGSSTWNFHVVTVVRYLPAEQSHDILSLANLAQQVKSDFDDVMNIEPKMLRKEHSNIWTALWSSGFGISYSLAAGVVNGDKINSTMYYVLSNVPSPRFELGRQGRDDVKLERLLYSPDRCYKEHHTLQNVKMWNDVTSIEGLINSVNTWLITLEKQGCDKMLKAGADGVLQAMMLSYGAFRFSSDHLEFGTHPSDLHRDYFFRRINYGNDTHINVSVKVGEDNRAVLYVSLDKNSRPFYACDAGCLDAPSQLSREVLTFPVKLTDPLTPILYITSNKQHLEDLKHAIHVKEIVDAPANEHHVMVLHKHGHHWGGLPMLFWATIGVLILVFHLFLFKLVYNEYCSGVEPKYPKYARGRYV